MVADTDDAPEAATEAPAADDDAADDTDTDEKTEGSK